MTLQLQYTATVSGLGQTITQPITRTGDGGISRSIAVPAGVTGTLTTRTDDNTGTITLTDSGSVSTGANVDIYWDGGVQYNVTVGTVSGTSCPIDSGIGDNLPSTSTAVVISVRQQVNADIDGDNLSLLAMKQLYTQSNETSASHVDFQESDNTEVVEVDLVANVPQVYDITGGATNIFTGDPIAKFFVSNGSSTNAATFQLLAVGDTTP